MGAGIQGSVVPAAAIEFPQREIVKAILDVALATPDNSDLAQLSAAVRFMRTQFALDTGVPNQLTVALSPTPLVWATPLAFFVKIGTGNTSTSTTVTCTITGVTGAKAVLLRDGTPPKVGDLAAGSVHLLVYDGSALRALTTVPSEKPQGLFVLNDAGGQTVLPNAVPTMLAHLTAIAAQSFADPTSSLASSRLTIGPRDAGLWLITGYYGITGAGQGQANVAICLNGVQTVGFQTTYVNFGVSGLSQTVLIRLVSGDVIQMQGTWFTATSTSAQAGQLSGVRIMG